MIFGINGTLLENCILAPCLKIPGTTLVLLKLHMSLVDNSTLELTKF